MENNEQLIKNTDIQEVAEKGEKIYEEIKQEYESEDGDKYLAIDVESRDVYLGDSTTEAVEKARSVHPDKVFYVVKVGSSASEILAGLEVVA